MPLSGSVALTNWDLDDWSIGHAQTSMELNNKLRATDEQMSVSTAYLSKVSIQERQSRWGEATDWVAQGGTGDEMLCDGEKPPGFNFGGGRSA